MRARRGLKPMATPTGMVQSAEISSAALTRRKVAPAPSSSRRRSAQVTVRSISDGLEDCPAGDDDDHGGERPEADGAFSAVRIFVERLNERRSRDRARRR